MSDAQDDWDLESATLQQARRPATSAFSVRLNREELAALRAAAKAAGMTTGEFIRNAALEKARADKIPAAFVGVLGHTFSIAWAAYIEAGAPFGESQEDLARWLEENPDRAQRAG